MCRYVIVRRPGLDSNSPPPDPKSHALTKVFMWRIVFTALPCICLLYTSDAADEEDSVDLGGRRIIKKKKKKKK